ncbi:hypothetical protein EO087_01890 [Dyella sp. M7H15-1]|uniref:tail fiber protein n=1 Tax=Dyella sp. M7H15-1 TaxID=2501295 RepID=UPI001004E31A|nr:tail fiber protein [Dyella sp. M7H15-1]QAU22890.1 hypothetical protein EO087_01890 [Dyella sp. M7H15-1]
MAGLTMIVTKAGRAALVNARSDGTKAVTVVSVGVTAQVFTPDPNMTTLPGESKRLATISGGATAPDTIHVTVRDDSSDAYDVRGIALYLADGTLFALYGQSAVLVQKSAQAVMLLATDTQFADIDATQLVLGDTDFQLNMATEQTPGVVQLAAVEEVLQGLEGDKAITLTTLIHALLAHPRYASGQIVWTAGRRALPGTLLCDGSAVSRVQFANLFAEIGVTYGVGDGSSTFSLPNLAEDVTVVHAGMPDKVGTFTGGSILSHGHAASVGAVTDHAHVITVEAGGDHGHNANTDAQGNHAHVTWTDAQGSHAHSGNTGGQSVDHSHQFEMRSMALTSGGPSVNVLQTGGIVSAKWSTSGASNDHYHGFVTDWQGIHAHNIGMSDAGNHAHNVFVAMGGNHSHVANSQAAGGHTHPITVNNTGSQYNLAAGVRMLACIAY